MLRALDLPQETAPDVQKITMVGRNDLLVENHAGVMRYDDAVVRLRTHEGVLTVTGKELTLLEMANTRAYIQGAIASIGME
ncbi:MAG: YabP/YqfC family sporulation protein [Clostridiales bacterium]|jgi:sporulation protein YqfC|nr:YabP/YqfC family sporulation protein [Clostridiales bacterium]